MPNIAIFASGTGTNAEKIIQYFEEKTEVQVKILLSNNKNALALEKAKKYQIPVASFNKKQFYESDFVLELLQKNQIDWIVLAGFLWLIPKNLLENFSNKIINIHPALLPKYGGKGMYGMKVHQAVFKNKEKETGITIHFVNEKYDEGKIIFQKSCEVGENDTLQSIQKKVQLLEHQYFPKVIENLLKSS